MITLNEARQLYENSKYSVDEYIKLIDKDIKRCAQSGCGHCCINIGNNYNIAGEVENIVRQNGFKTDFLTDGESYSLQISWIQQGLCYEK